METLIFNALALTSTRRGHEDTLTDEDLQEMTDEVLRALADQYTPGTPAHHDGPVQAMNLASVVALAAQQALNCAPTNADENESHDGEAATPAADEDPSTATRIIEQIEVPAQIASRRYFLLAAQEVLGVAVRLQREDEAYFVTLCGTPTSVARARRLMSETLPSITIDEPEDHQTRKALWAEAGHTLAVGMDATGAARPGIDHAIAKQHLIAAHGPARTLRRPTGDNLAGLAATINAALTASDTNPVGI